jgi:HSP20 family protein
MADLQPRDELLSTFDRIFPPMMLERLFGPALARLGERQGLWANAWAPAIDVSEDDKAYHLSCDLPSVKREDIEISVKDGVLSIRGERRNELDETDPKRKVHRVERSYGRFERMFTLPDDVDEQKIDAKCRDGQLDVTLPKSKKANGARKIAVS